MDEKVIELLSSMNEKLDSIANSLIEIEGDSEMTRIASEKNSETLELIQDTALALKHLTTDPDSYIE